MTDPSDVREKPPPEATPVEPEDLREEKKAGYAAGSLAATGVAFAWKKRIDKNYRNKVKKTVKAVTNPLLDDGSPADALLHSRITKAHNISISDKDLASAALKHGRQYAHRRKIHEKELKDSLKKSAGKLSRNKEKNAIQLKAIEKITSSANQTKLTQAALAAVIEQIALEQGVPVSHANLSKGPSPKAVAAATRQSPHLGEHISLVAEANGGTISGKLLSQAQNNYVPSKVLAPLKGERPMLDVAAMVRAVEKSIGSKDALRVTTDAFSEVANTAAPAAKTSPPGEVAPAITTIAVGPPPPGEAPTFRAPLPEHLRQSQKTVVARSQQGEGGTGETIGQMPTTESPETTSPTQTPTSSQAAPPQQQRKPGLEELRRTGQGISNREERVIADTKDILKKKPFISRSRVPRLRTPTALKSRLSAITKLRRPSFLNRVPSQRVAGALRSFARPVGRALGAGARAGARIALQIGGRVISAGIRLVATGFTGAATATGITPVVIGIALIIAVILLLVFDSTDPRNAFSIPIDDSVIVDGEPPGPINPGVVASGTCPLVGNVNIKTPSYNPATETGHGSNSYWEGRQDTCDYAIPIMRIKPMGGNIGCRGPNGAGSSNNVCASETNVCAEYGFAADVAGGTDVVLPAICEPGETSCPTLTWSVDGGWFNCAGSQVSTRANCTNPANQWGYGMLFSATDGSGNDYVIYLNHIDPVPELLSETDGAVVTSTRPFFSGEQAGTITQDNASHLHIELSINGAPVRPDFLCGGGSLNPYENVVKQIDEYCTDVNGTTYCFPVSTDPQTLTGFSCTHGASRECSNLANTDDIRLSEPYAASDIYAEGSAGGLQQLPLFAYTDGVIIESVDSGACVWEQTPVCPTGLAGPSTYADDPNSASPYCSCTSGNKDNVNIGEPGFCCPIGGSRVKIRGNDNRYYLYAHLSEIMTPGGSVVAGQRIGSTGESGRSVAGAEHVHFAISDESSFETQLCSAYSASCDAQAFTWPQPEFQQFFNLSCNGARPSGLQCSVY